VTNAKASPAQKTAQDRSGTSDTDNILKLRDFSFSASGNSYREVGFDGGARHENLTLVTRSLVANFVAACR
jgi:hypothetical protein